MNLYDILHSLRKFISEKTGVRTDIVYDGYKYPTSKPFFNIHYLMDELNYLVKNNEAIQSIEHIQLSYHAEYFADMTKMSDDLTRLFVSNKVPYYKADGAGKPIGFFDVKISAVTPMPAEDGARESEHHRIHFDLEIEKIIRRG